MIVAGFLLAGLVLTAAPGHTWIPRERTNRAYLR